MNLALKYLFKKNIKVATMTSSLISDEAYQQEEEKRKSSFSSFNTLRDAVERLFAAEATRYGNVFNAENIRKLSRDFTSKNEISDLLDKNKALLLKIKPEHRINPTSTSSMVELQGISPVSKALESFKPLVKAEVELQAKKLSEMQKVLDLSPLEIKAKLLVSYNYRGFIREFEEILKKQKPDLYKLLYGSQIGSPIIRAYENKRKELFLKIVELNKAILDTQINAGVLNWDSLKDSIMSLSSYPMMVFFEDFEGALERPRLKNQIVPPRANPFPHNEENFSKFKEICLQEINALNPKLPQIFNESWIKKEYGNLKIGGKELYELKTDTINWSSIKEIIKKTIEEQKTEIASVGGSITLSVDDTPTLETWLKSNGIPYKIIDDVNHETKDPEEKRKVFQIPAAYDSKELHAEKSRLLIEKSKKQTIEGVQEWENTTDFELETKDIHMDPMFVIRSRKSTVLHPMFVWRGNIKDARRGIDSPYYAEKATFIYNLDGSDIKFINKHDDDKAPPPRLNSYIKELILDETRASHDYKQWFETLPAEVVERHAIKPPTAHS